VPASRDHFAAVQITITLSAMQNAAPSLKDRPAQTQPLVGTGSTPHSGANVGIGWDPTVGDGAGWA
jgi:hypothetical protein